VAGFGGDARRGGVLTRSAMILMATILGFVWGGFALILLLAIKKERAKRSDVSPE